MYVLFLEVRVTIPDSDLTRVIEEFSFAEMSSYNLREPLYWAAGKLLTAITQDGWMAIFILDMFGLGCLLYVFRKQPLPALFIIALFCSPLFVLGINNIHRQLIGFSLWLLIEKETLNRGAYRMMPWHLVPFLVHTSMGILSLIYYICYAIKKGDLKILGSIVLALSLFIGLFPDAASGFFREGTETTTSLAVYAAWAVAVAVPVVAAARKVSFVLIFYALGALASTVLFVFSGGSSGSRFFIMFVTITSIWVVARILPVTDQPPLMRFGILFAVSALLAAPTFLNEFSLDILRSAVLRTQFGMNY